MVKFLKKIPVWFYIVTFVFLILILLFLYDKKTELPAVKIPVRNSVRVTRVIDGDTFEIEAGKRVRYIGIDTPELATKQKSAQCFSQEAAEKNKELIEGKTVQLEKDRSETDRYGRLLRYVYINNTFVNKILIEEGFAKVDAFLPDVKYYSLLKEAETQAKTNRKGLWNSCIMYND